MNGGLILESLDDFSVSSQKEIKINYLIKEKDRLEELVNELQNNNSVMRNVI